MLKINIWERLSTHTGRLVVSADFSKREKTVVKYAKAKLDKLNSYKTVICRLDGAPTMKKLASGYNIWEFIYTIQDFKKGSVSKKYKGVQNVLLHYRSEF